MSRSSLLLGFTVPDRMAKALFARDPLPAVQTHHFAWSLARTMRSAFGEVRLLSACPVQSFPHARVLFLAGERFVENDISGVTIPFANLPGLKHVSRLVFAFSCLCVEFIRQKPQVMFVHGAHTPFLALGALARLFRVKVVAVVTDMPGVVLPTDGAVRRLLKCLDRVMAAWLLARSSGVMALSPALIEGRLAGLPHVILPGLLNSSWLALPGVEKMGLPARPRKTVLYAGTVNNAYGIGLLLAAAKRLPDIDFVICGRGDALEHVRAAGGNILHGGFLPPEDLIEHYRSADILINTRPSGEEFSVKSFPSKILEYMSMGKVVLTTPVHALPDDLAFCLNIIADETPEGVAAAIRSVLGSFDAASERAAKGREIVLEAYSEAAAARRLRAFVDALSG